MTVDVERLRSLVVAAHATFLGEEREFALAGYPVVLAYLLHAEGTSEPDVRDRPRSAPGVKSTEMLVGEFLAGLHIDAHPQRVVAIAYYQWHRLGAHRGATTKDLIDAYTKVRAKKPQNFPDVIASCVRRGWVVDIGRQDGAKAWAITSSGERVVERDL